MIHYTEYSLHVYQTLYTPAHSLHTHYTAHYLWVSLSIPAENCTISHYRMHSTPYTLHYCTLTTHCTTLHIICGWLFQSSRKLCNTDYMFTPYTPHYCTLTHCTIHYLWAIISIPAESYTITHYRIQFTRYTLHYCTTHYTLHTTHYLWVNISIPAGNCTNCTITHCRIHLHHTNHCWSKTFKWAT
jgi:hypothetical protein